MERAKPKESDSRNPHKGGLNLPSRIGHYSILDELGRGGMGTVYLAEQHEPIERRVALKVIINASLDAQTLLRFDAERRALARLEHPNIAHLYDVGSTEDGSPFFAMELIQGTPVTAFCNRNRLNIEARLEIFVKICDGVAHAHQKGILHRDLKPGNILVTKVDGTPIAKIIDFGIAKAMDQPLVEATLQTECGFIGTPAYMSPEIVEGSENVDTRSDVYSLGVILYELLVGVRPLGEAHEAPQQVLRRILDEEPLRPSTRWRSMDPGARGTAAHNLGFDEPLIGKKLKGDIDWIVMKAIAREPEQRYSSAHDLAADITRHLRHEAVEACPESTAYLVRKFVRRNKGLVVSLCAILILLLAGIAGTSIGLLQARRSSALARTEAASARQAEAEAGLVSEFLISLFEDVDPLDAKRLDVPHGENVSARQLLDRGTQRIRQELQEQPQLRATLLRTLGRVYSSLDLPNEAHPLLEEAVELTSELHGELHIETIQSQRDLGRLLENLTDYEGASHLYEQSMQNALDLFGEEHEETIRSTQFAAKLLLTRGEVDRAQPMLARNIEVARQVLGNDDPAVADGVNALAWLHYSRGEYEAAEQRFREAAGFGLARYGQGDADRETLDDNPNLAIAYNNLAWVLVLRNKIDEAEETIEAAMGAMRRTLPAAHWRIANAESILGAIRTRQGRFDEAERLLLESLPKVRESTGERSPYTRVLLERLIDCYERWNKPQRAEKYRQRLHASSY